MWGTDYKHFRKWVLEICCIRNIAAGTYEAGDKLFPKICGLFEAVHGFVAHKNRNWKQTRER